MQKRKAPCSLRGRHSSRKLYCWPTHALVLPRLSLQPVPLAITLQGQGAVEGSNCCTTERALGLESRNLGQKLHFAACLSMLCMDRSCVCIHSFICSFMHSSTPLHIIYLLIHPFFLTTWGQGTYLLLPHPPPASYLWESYLTPLSPFLQPWVVLRTKQSREWKPVGFL